MKHDTEIKRSPDGEQWTTGACAQALDCGLWSSRWLRLPVQLFVVFQLFISVGAWATEKIPPMRVQITPAVQKQIDKMTAAERTRIKKAVDVAQSFLTLRFASKDVVTTQVAEDIDRWDGQVGPLMAMSAWDWEQVWNKEGWHIDYGFFVRNKRIVGTLLSCDAAMLTKLECRNATYELTYRVKLIGADPNNAYENFYINHPGEAYVYELTVIIGKKWKVDLLKTSNAIVAENFEYRLSEYNEWISRASLSDVRRRLNGKYKAIRDASSACKSNQ